MGITEMHVQIHACLDCKNKNLYTYVLPRKSVGIGKYFLLENWISISTPVLTSTQGVSSVLAAIASIVKSVSLSVKIRNEN